MRSSMAGPGTAVPAKGRPMEPSLHVVGYGWSPEHPVLRVRTLFGEPAETVHLQGEVAFGVGVRCCIGHRDGDRQVPCPTRRRLSSGRQCEGCLAKDTFRPCMTCDGSRCPPLHPAARATCRSTHHLYLADFGGPVLKVGTAADPRRDARLHDQGPIAALRVAAGPGPKIKQIERFASTHTELVEAMRRDRKRTLLRSRMGEDEALERLTDALADLRDAGPPHEELFGLPHQVQLPALARRTRARIDHQAELPVREERVIRGRVLGAIGSVVLLEDEGHQQLLELGDLVGHAIDPSPPDDLPPPAMQLGLF